jgi:uncharacterized membrane protein YphA (DoxX/SURF4 family)
MSMQRTFSSFPSGWAGMALIVLRVVVGALAASQAGLIITGSNTILSLATLAAISMAIAGLALMIGFLTPIASVLICLGEAVIMITCVPSAPLPLFDSRMGGFEFVVMSAVLVILGPGAFSVDARLFGLREVVICAAPRRNDF